jgi:hypothetical protein
MKFQVETLIALGSFTMGLCSALVAVSRWYKESQRKECGEKRSHFGIHRDANAPGSAGCIVLPTQTGWNSFKRQMEDLADAGIKQIPLQIDYPN